MSDQLTPGMEKILDTVAKLLALASKNPNANEAAAAAAKAQAMMTQYNIDTTLIERRQGRVDGKRENAALKGGFYKYQRQLYQSVARLNFCMYFCEYYWHAYEPPKSIRGRLVGGRNKIRHRLVGRQVNVMASRAMATYLEDAIERLTRDRLRKSDGAVDQSQMMSSWATSFRGGAAHDLISRIDDQRMKEDTKRQAEKKKQEAAMGPGSTSTTLTIADIQASEEAGNYDFLHGEGAWARLQAMRAENAAELRKQREAMAKMAKEDPEAYAKLEAERRKGRRRSSMGKKEREPDWSAFYAGRDAAKDISIHQQVGDAPAGKLT